MEIDHDKVLDILDQCGDQISPTLEALLAELHRQLVESNRIDKEELGIDDDEPPTLAVEDFNDPYNVDIRGCVDFVLLAKAVEADNKRLRDKLSVIAGFGSVDMRSEYEPGLRGAIRAMVDCAIEGLK